MAFSNFFFFLTYSLSENWNGAPKSCLKRNLHSTTKQTSKIITRKQPHQHTHTKWSGKEKKRQAEKRERKPKKAQERSDTQNKKHTSKTKKWEKRLNENYFKLFRRRRNRKAEKQIQKQQTTTTKKTKNVSVREKAERRRWRREPGARLGACG